MGGRRGFEAEEIKVMEEKEGKYERMRIDRCLIG